MSQQSSQQQSYTIWSPHDTVKDVADSLGISNTNDDVLRSLAMDVEYRILEIVEQAVKFKRHSKRSTLTTSDVAKALRVLNVEPLYGFEEGSAKNEPVKFNKLEGANGQTLYYLDDEEIDFEKLINTPLPEVPRLPTFTAHWLAVEGIQPAIPQNPNINELRLSQVPLQRGAIVSPLNETSVQTSLQTNVNEERQATANGPISTQVKPGAASEAKPLVKHVLSKELQIYFEKVASALTSKEEDINSQRMRAAALTSLKSDTGLHQLVPYFIQFIAEQITHHLEDLELLTTMLEMIYSLLSNQSVFLDPYIHSLMPSILTLLLAKRLGGNGSKNSSDDKIVDQQNKKEFLEKTNAVRDFASSLLDHVLKKFPKVHKSLKPRVTRTLLKTFLDINRSFGTYYGCVRGVSVLGNETIRFFLGNLQNWSKLVFEEYDRSQSEDSKSGKNLTDLEIKLLSTVIVSTLEKLKSDLPSSYNPSGDFSEEDKTRLRERCGITVGNVILERDDAKTLYDAIFFGEL